jgi:hypothetical protein
MINKYGGAATVFHHKGEYHRLVFRLLLLANTHECPTIKSKCRYESVGAGCCNNRPTPKSNISPQDDRAPRSLDMKCEMWQNFNLTTQRICHCGADFIFLFPSLALFARGENASSILANFCAGVFRAKWLQSTK